jgi:hypothetical protein
MPSPDVRWLTFATIGPWGMGNASPEKISESELPMGNSCVFLLFLQRILMISLMALLFWF